MSAAIEVYAGTSVTGTTDEATGEDISTCSNLDYNDVWYYYVRLPAEEVIHICSGILFDTTLSLFDAVTGSELACNDDYCDKGSALYRRQDGHPYYIRVSGFNGDHGSFTLTVRRPTP